MSASFPLFYSRCAEEGWWKYPACPEGRIRSSPTPSSDTKRGLESKLEFIIFCLSWNPYTALGVSCGEADPLSIMFYKIITIYIYIHNTLSSQLVLPTVYSSQAGRLGGILSWPPADLSLCFLLSCPIQKPLF